jgi:hypothetical protein
MRFESILQCLDFEYVLEKSMASRSCIFGSKFLRAAQRSKARNSGTDTLAVETAEEYLLRDCLLGSKVVTQKTESRCNLISRYPNPLLNAWRDGLSTGAQFRVRTSGARLRHLRDLG